VTVANIIFPPGQRIHPDGFGYLVPRDAHGHVGVLGTIFDSCALDVQDAYASPGAPHFTKLTMMLRRGAEPATQAHLLARLTEHLAPRAPLPQPVYFCAHDMVDCIPTPTVGHLQRTRELQHAAQKEWNGRLEIIGAGVGGVSVGNCVEQGREAGKAWGQ
jgi:protoporphyrinogen/coproporphyrinogen III oxidase